MRIISTLFELTVTTVKELFNKTETEAKKSKLIVNEIENTKYMWLNKQKRRNRLRQNESNV